MKYISRRPAPARHDGACRHVARAQLGDLGDGRRLTSRRTARATRSQVRRNSRRRISSKTAGEDAGEKRGRDAADHDHARDEPAQRGQRHHIAGRSW